MKKFSIVTWICTSCHWAWNTLSTIVEDSDQCPNCRSLYTAKVKRLKRECQ
jgi:rubrerythrin